MLGVFWGPQKREYLATIRTCQKVSIWKTYQNFKSEDNNHLSITNRNRACFAKLAPRGFQEVTRIFPTPAGQKAKVNEFT